MAEDLIRSRDPATWRLEMEPRGREPHPHARSLALMRPSRCVVLATMIPACIPHSNPAELCCCAGTFHERSQYFMRLWICGIGEVVKFTPLGLAFNVNGPSLTNTQVCSQGSVIPCCIPE